MNMNSDTLFAMALGLQAPWSITKVDFVHEPGVAHQLHLHIGFASGSKFKDDAGIDCPVHDSVPRKWQHLNFFEHHCFLHCDVPRITTSDGKVRNANVPWARAGSGFTLLFEAFALALIEREMPVNRVAQILGVNAQRIWTVFGHWVEQARANDDPSSITRLGVDETSSKKGHSYVTLGVDLDNARVIHVCEGKGKDTMAGIARHLKNRDVPPEQIEHVSMDLSPSFISGAKKFFPKAQITFDRFHVVKLLNEAMNSVRMLERKEHAELKGHKYTFLKNKGNLSVKKRQWLDATIILYPTLGAAYRLKELFNDLWSMPDKEAANAFLQDWCAQVEQAKIPALQKFANTVRSHWSGIVAFVETNITNAILESINSKIQLAKRRARGFRNVNNYINMIHFLCGKLTFSYPRYFT
jgi:transposase